MRCGVCVIKSSVYECSGNKKNEMKMSGGEGEEYAEIQRRGQVMRQNIIWIVEVIIRSHDPRVLQR